jgi:ABC-type multidrug transport system ATPase subunit
MRKNYLLKTKGVLRCCTLCEILVPVIFLGLMCLPKALVPDSRTNDELSRPYALAGGIESVNQRTPRGFRFVVAPASAETLELGRRAYVHAMCLSERSIAKDRSYANDFEDGKKNLLNLMDDQVQASSNVATGVKSAFAALSYDVTAMPAACSDACLQDSSCVASTWDAILDEVVVTKADEAAAMAYVASRPGEVFAYARFDSGGNVASTRAFAYTLRLNSTNVANEDKAVATFMEDDFTGRWDSAYNTDDWAKYKSFAYAQNAFDAAIIDMKDGGSAYSVTLDTSLKPFPWLGFDYNVGGVIAAAFYGFVGSLAFQTNVVLVMKSIVVEKELRLREGMKMMGMSNTMFWWSWFFTHWLSAMISVVLITLVGIYPFSYTNQFIQFIFYTFWVASLTLWNFWISTFFSKSITATIVGCFAYVLTMVPSIAVRITQPEGSGAWILACIFPSGAMNMWGAALAILEVNKKGITMETFNEDVTLKGNVTCAGILGMVIFDCLFYAFLTFYFDAVWKTEYGTRQPPWFLFTRKYWCGDASKVIDDETLGMHEQESGDAVEPLTKQQMKSASVVVRGLTKKFGDEVTAVDNLSMTFVPGQVSGLLGHNGAGKTTTISVLTGMIERTSGRATIDGYDTKTQMREIRAGLGICPQFDVLWPTLTVREHLQLYAAFAGMQKEDVERELKQVVEEVALTEKIDANSKDLSGGMKRKLSLAIAFIGSPSVVFLDEPTSGMDPYSRRFTWDVIRKRAANCTVLLTTHFLDEADLLCDRVAIMSAGHLACIGSPLFLKSKFGTGYLLTFARHSRASSTQIASMTQHNSNAMLRVIQHFVPKAVVHSDVGAELSFSLPFESTGDFSALFKALDEQIGNLGYASYGISCTTLEEVFLSLAHGVKAASTAQSKGKVVDLDAPVEEADECEDLDAKLVAGNRKDIRQTYAKGGALLRIQLKRLLWKRWLNWRRSMRSIFMQLLVPCLLVVLALYLTTLSFEPGSTISAKEISRKLLDNKKTLVTYSPSATEAVAVTTNLMTDTYALRSQYQPEISCMCNCLAKDQTITMSAMTCCAYNRTIESTCRVAALARLAGGTYCVKSPKGYDVQRDIVSMGLSCSSMIDDSIDSYLLDVQEPSVPCDMQPTGSPCDVLYVDEYNGTRYSHTLYGHQTALHGMPTVINNVNSAILRKRTSDSSASITTTIHWYPSAVNTLKEGDIEEPDNSGTTFIVSMFVVMGLAVLSAGISIFPVYERCNNSKHLQLVSGIDKRIYWLAHYVADAIQLVIPFAVIVVIFAGFNASYFQGQLGAITVLLGFFMLTSIPHAHYQGFWYTSEYYTFVGQIGTNTTVGVITTIAGIVTDALKDLNKETLLVSKIFNYTFPLIIPHFSFGKGLYDIAQNGLDKTRKIFREDCMCLVPVVPKGSFNVIADDLGYLIGTFFMWSALLFYKEYKENFASWILMKRGNSQEVSPSVDEDEDVRAERERVLSGDIDGDGVIMDRLSKTYKGLSASSTKLAVRNLSVGLHRDQCFGLLGINGAGKTTTFKMLTGEFPPSAGDAIIQDRDGASHSVRTDLNDARRLMGYCPQFNGLQPNFTAREHIEFYAAIRGMPTEMIPRVTEDLLQRMGLTLYADRQAGTYSGGNKRKLSVALSLVGEPEVVFLDEPSTGMDPEARRFMWDVISSMMVGRTIVLTSHSMEECEALCNRIGIMVSGEFKCLGSLQHLKSRFSEGYSIDLRFSDGKGNAVMEALRAKHGDIGAEIVETHATEIKLRVMNPEMKLWRIFDAVEALKQSDDDGARIDDYSVSQTTLEQVFIRFAKEQTEEIHAAPGLQ